MRQDFTNCFPRELHATIEKLNEEQRGMAE
jgi:hypothetical protein